MGLVKRILPAKLFDQIEEMRGWINENQGQNQIPLIKVLQIKNLRDRINEFQPGPHNQQRLHLFETCFNILKGNKPQSRFAGHVTFSDFLETPVGQEVCRSPRISVDNEGKESETGSNLKIPEELQVQDPCDPDNPRQLTAEEVREQIAQYPQLANDPLIYFMLESANSGHSFNEPKILAEFRRLIDQNTFHQRRFGGLSDRRLVKTLQNYVMEIIKPSR